MGYPAFGCDEGQRNHPVEEEVVGVAAGPRELGRAETLGKRQPFENLEVFLGRRRVVGQPFVPDPRLAGDDDRQPDAVSSTPILVP